jgi:ubiquinone/menaquinone biosynthesis C-methylase UbiE
MGPRALGRPVVLVAEMNRVARWFVNHFNARANRRRVEWLAGALALPPEAVALEIGCGGGDLATRLVDTYRPARFVATDLDPAQLEAAHRLVARRFGARPPPGLEFRPADMTRLPFPDRAFDAVFAFSTLHHAGATHGDFASVERALAEVDRVLEPGGAFVYEEFLHTDRIRRWLDGRSYAPVAHLRRWRRDRRIVRKASGRRDAPDVPS